jgi:hypothetical protein
MNALLSAIFGLTARLPEPCRCGSNVVTIEASKNSNCAALRCACGCHRGLVSKAAARFLAEIIVRFGTPTERIVVRDNSSNICASAQTATPPSGAGAIGIPATAPKLN